MATLSQRQFLEARFNDDDNDDDYADYLVEVIRHHARMKANLVSSILCFMVMTKSFMEVAEIFAQVMN